MRLPIEVSPGEAADKLTILRIKQERIADPAKLAHIGREAEMLEAALAPLRARFPAILPLIEELRRVNEALWEVEDALRLHEKRGDFGAEFVRLARSVYATNDRRAAIKAEINRILGSDIAEQKSYA
ncbi:MAG: DUF6165 family protein [Acetobacteraceae bacterium]|nr:DUF6165 family protein [Acetobacteraceae bacterium]MCX7685148.1 DUF6165 family protein [Acetobacteraceae bacterium]MDW8399352.1 DUF6165 family protein [Acetobacteraceae bacterium]